MPNCSTAAPSVMRVLAVCLTAVAGSSVSCVVARDPNRGASAIRPSAVVNVERPRAARAADLRVRVLRLTSNDVGPNGATVALAYVINASDSPVRIFVPGLRGPILSARAGSAEGVPFSIGRAPEYSARDFSVIAPGELIGRSVALPTAAPDLTISAFYNVYRNGREGDNLEIVGTIFSDVLEARATRPSTSGAP